MACLAIGLVGLTWAKETAPLGPHVQFGDSRWCYSPRCAGWDARRVRRADFGIGAWLYRAFVLRHVRCDGCHHLTLVARSTPLLGSAKSPQQLKYLRLAVLTTILAYLQIVAGAVVRHSPHLIGQSAPAVFQAAVYFHVLLALAILVHGILLVWQASRSQLSSGRCWLLMSLIGVQIALGGSTWIVKYGLPRWASRILGDLTYANTADDAMQAIIVTSHVAVGSLIFVTALAIALRAGRILQIGVSETVRSTSSRLGAVL